MNYPKEEFEEEDNDIFSEYPIFEMFPQTRRMLAVIRNEGRRIREIAYMQASCDFRGRFSALMEDIAQYEHARHED